MDASAVRILQCLLCYNRVFRVTSKAIVQINYNSLKSLQSLNKNAKNLFWNKLLSPKLTTHNILKYYIC